MSKKRKTKEAKHGLVVGTTPDSFCLVDKRLMKPVCHQSFNNGVLEGSMLIQSVDKVSISRRNNVSYFVPNNIALLLSISNKSLKEAKAVYSKYFSNKEIELDLEKMTNDRGKMMSKASSLVCDYLESIQSSIVFGYTAIEAFVDLSIPEQYEYTTDKNSKGISETYDKEAIERWLPLRTKVKLILTDIYQTKTIESQKWWEHFICMVGALYLFGKV